MSELGILYIQKKKGILYESDHGKVSIIADALYRLAKLDCINGCFISPGYMCSTKNGKIIREPVIELVQKTLYSDGNPQLSEFILLDSMANSSREEYLEIISDLNINAFELCDDALKDHRKMIFLYSGLIGGEKSDTEKIGKLTDIDFSKIKVKAVFVGSSNYSKNTYLGSEKGEADVILFDLSQLSIYEELEKVELESILVPKNIEDHHVGSYMSEEFRLPYEREVWNFNRDAIMTKSIHAVSDDYLDKILRNTLEGKQMKLNI